MDKSAMKKVLAGLSIAGLVTSVTLTGCQKANGSCGAGSCSKTEKVEGGDASKGTGSCSGMEDTSAHGTGSCAGMKDDAAAGEGSSE
ncbi:SbtA family thio(seleno)oxazole RiPP natural product precursor [Prosthecochloris sp.]|uniref:SbtA family thio(seleno)oxazole RiPP natural product precursor n=1 Tax=Prosthecochloris sp. TaxID=290513 RepID=UPI0025DD6DC2|nr:SbtA family thio(seleno)oxazole RiPP natural product precursor [Prosthecochloris sp.]